MPDLNGAPQFVPYTAAPTHLGAFRQDMPYLTGTVRRVNNAEGGALLIGTAVTQGVGGNSGGGSGDFFDVLQVGANATFAFDNAHVGHGSASYLIATGASSVQSNAAWTTQIGQPQEKLFWRIYPFTPNSFANTPTVSRMQAAGSQVSRIGWNATGNLIIRDASNGLIATSTNALAVSTRYRVEGYTQVGTSGVSELKIFSDIDGPLSNPLETLTITGNFGSTFIDQWQVGQVAAAANIPSWWADDVGIWSVDYLGPVGPEMPPSMPRRARRALVTIVRRWRSASPPLVPVDLPDAPARPRARLLPTRRGRGMSPPADRGAPPASPRARRRVLATRHAHPPTQPPPTQTPVPQAPCRMPRRLAPARRPTRPQPPWAPVVVAQPNLWLPRAVPRPRVRVLPVRHHAAGVWWPPVASCETDRPDTGIITYALATTARPGSGTTNRPGSGTTARPNTGITEDPC